MTRLKRWTLYFATTLAVILILSAIAGLMVLRSDRFREYLQQRIVSEIEKATGGRAELGRLSVDWKSMNAQVAPLVLHGKEAPGEPPLLQVDSATLGLRIISVMEKKVDLASLRVEKPQVRIVVYPDGSTNIPGPPARSEKIWSEELLNLAVREYEFNDGLLEYDNRKIPLNLRGEHLRAHLTYDAGTPSYRGEISSDGLRVTPPGLGPIETKMSAVFALEKSRIVFSRLQIATKESSADLAGTLEDLRAPHGTLSIIGSGAVAELVRLFKLPIDPTGSAVLDGKLSISFGDPFDFGITGRVTARGLRYRHERLNVEGAEMRGNIELSQDDLVVRNMTVQALGASITGQAKLDHWRQFDVEGTIAGLDLRRAVGILTARPVAWNGTLTGRFAASATVGQTNATVRANLAITPVAGGSPLQGQIDAAYDQATGTLALGSSAIATPATRVELSGTLGPDTSKQTLRVRLRTTDLNDLLPALAMVEDKPPSEMPLLKLKNGSAAIDGTVTGPLDDPHFVGQATVSNGEVQGYAFDRFAGEIDATLREIQASQVVLGRGITEVTGSAKLTAREGSFEDATVTSQLSIRNAALGDLVREAGSSLAITGMGSAALSLSGTVRRPEVDAAIDVQGISAFDEKIDRARANVRYTPGSVDLSNGIASTGPAEARFSGSYRFPTGDWKTGDAVFDVLSQNLDLSRIEHLTRSAYPAEGVLAGRLRGTAKIENGVFRLTAATADLTAPRLVMAQREIRGVTLTAETKGTELTARASGQVLESMIQANGAWQLEGDSPGKATVSFSRLSIDSLHQLVMAGIPTAERPEAPPVEGFLEGGASITLALQNLRGFQALVTLDPVQVNPRPSQALKLGVQPQDVILKNSQPVVADVTINGATLRSAKFTGRDTNITASGTIPFTAGSNANLALDGDINLAILQLVNPDLLASGKATVQTTIRGNLQDPLVNGHLDLSHASVFLKDVPYGVDDVGGRILFDSSALPQYGRRNRATIDGKLTAQTLGGKVDVTGNVDFGSSTLIYRLQAQAAQVRVRAPEDLSTTFDADLSLTGSSDASTLSGTVTVNRAVFNPRGDLGQLLAQLSQSVPAPTPNDYLRGTHFDVRIRTSPNFQIETSLTRDVEAEAELTLRGTPLRPVVLGTISVNQGEVQFLGTKYIIDRGEIRFFNTVKIEPSFDMDLTTKLKGVTVTITFSGTMQKPKLNYSSDPPLQSSEIIALLAVGRDPSLGSSLTAFGNSTGGTAGFTEAGSGLLGQAFNAQLSSRLQRFFGASHVKIDPTLTGVDNLPQARLTLEQQVSKDITMTFITNLNRTQEQLVRVQWDFNRNWSAIAVRDPSGLFGIDFQYRKRF
jgi:translocation and assembly module TamB